MSPRQAEQSTASQRRWAIVRIALGTGQVFGATLGLFLLLETGVNMLTVGVAGGTLGLTLLSRALFRD